jgi:hypothetical protein
MYANQALFFPLGKKNLKGDKTEKEIIKTGKNLHGKDKKCESDG